MIVNSPTKEQSDVIFSIAESLGIETTRHLKGNPTFPDVWFSGRKIAHCVAIPDPIDIPVTFQEFITAMVTPEEETEKKSEKPMFKKRIITTDFGINLWPILSSEAIDRAIKEFQEKPLMVFHRINPREVELEAENKALKEKLAEAEKKASEKEPVEEDKRVDFGENITFQKLRSDIFPNPAFIGSTLAKKGDANKVLIAEEGYTFKIREDYCEGRPALEIHKL
jgi:hypothetical protein